MYANEGLQVPTLIKNNVYSGSTTCDYKLIIGKGDNINYAYMMNSNQLFAEVKCQSVQRQTILGMLLPERKKQCFVLLNFGAGQARVSGNSEISTLATQALYQQWSNPLLLHEIIELLGGKISSNKDKADYNLSLNRLGKDTLVKIFTENDLNSKKR
jgi:hypothetical protein